MQCMHMLEKTILKSAQACKHLDVLGRWADYSAYLLSCFEHIKSLTKKVPFDQGIFTLKIWWEAFDLCDSDDVLWYSKMHGCTFFFEIQSQEEIFDPGRRIISKLQDLSAYLRDEKLRCINMHQHYNQDVSKWFKMYLSTRFKLWNPGVASSPMGVKLVALSFDLSRARGFGGESFSSLAAMDAKSSACFLDRKSVV